jgi:predicted tellurium resistance membrane protein TerC
VQTFDEVFVLTGGGPGLGHHLRGAVHLPDRLRQEQVRLYGLAAAASLLLALALIALTLLHAPPMRALPGSAAVRMPTIGASRHGGAKQQARKQADHGA